jgi:predicted MPP superfamily phosphohydrolase
MNLFLLTFFLIYSAAHVYFFHKVDSVISLSFFSGIFLALFLMLMIFAPVSVRLLEKEGMEVPARLMAYTGYIWMGFLFLFISASLVIELYHCILLVIGYSCHRNFGAYVLTNRAALISPLLWGMSASVYAYFEARDIKTERVVIRSSKISKEPGNLTIVQMSDVHLGLIVREERLNMMLARVKAAKPDLLVVTGDLVDGQISGLTGLAELLRDVRPRYGKFAVTGNHELYSGFYHSVAFMESAGFKVLRGEQVPVPGGVTIAGVDDPAIARYSGSSSEEEKSLLSHLPKDTYNILLKHRPTIIKEGLGRFDLQISGHVHKGQLFPFNLITYLFYPVKAGLNRYPQDTDLYVSRGTGTWGPPMRFLAPPEVTVIELKHSAES